LWNVDLGFVGLGMSLLVISYFCFTRVGVISTRVYNGIDVGRFVTIVMMVVMMMMMMVVVG